MTREDILVVEENTHLRHFIFDLVRCIDEGVPVANYFACADMQSGGGDNALFNAQKYIADSLQKRVFFGGTSKCKFNVGDVVVLKGHPEYGKKSIGKIVDVIIGVDENGNTIFSSGVAMYGYGNARVFPMSYVNRNFELAE